MTYRPYECACGHEWTVAVHWELGRWWSVCEDEEFCPECGKPGDWQDSMDEVTRRRLRKMARGEKK